MGNLSTGIELAVNWYWHINQNAFWCFQMKTKLEPWSLLTLAKREHSNLYSIDRFQNAWLLCPSEATAVTICHSHFKFIDYKLVKSQTSKTKSMDP